MIVWPVHVRHKLLYLAATFGMLLPLMLPGYVLTLDMVFTPEVRLPDWTTPSYPFYALLKLLGLIIPVWLLQKILLVSIFLGAGVAMHSLVRYLQKDSVDIKLAAIAQYGAGLLYIYNPFTYSRLMAGQFAVLMGYALLPLVLLLAFRFFERPSSRSALLLAASCTAMSIASIHVFGLALLCIAVIGVSHIIQKRHRIRWENLITSGLIGVALLAATTAYWLVPAVLGHGKLYATTASFSSADQAAFRTDPGSIGLLGNILALHGFWGDSKNIYLTSPDMYDWWLIPIFILWLFVMVGIVYGWRKHRQMAIIFLVIGAIGFVCSSGPVGSLFAPLNNWLLDNFILYKGYREPQKFSILIVISYCYFVALAIPLVLRRIGARLRNYAVAGMLVVLIGCAPLLPWGGQGQLQSAWYPEDWHATNEYLVGQGPHTKALFLPWHLYMPFQYSERIIANPAPRFFDVPVISSNDPEMANARAYTTSGEVAQVTKLLQHADTDENIAGNLRRLGITHIILAKEFDYAKYQYLDSAAGIKKVRNTPTLSVYTVE